MTVTVKREGKADLVLEASLGGNLMHVLSEAGVGLDAPCAGRGKCGKCLVELAGDLAPLTNSEKKFVDSETSSFRLACETIIKAPLVVTLADTSQTFAAVKGLGLTPPYVIDSPLKIKLLEAVERDNPHPRNEVLGVFSSNPNIYRDLAQLEDLRKSAWGIVWHNELIKVFSDDADEALMPEAYVLAVDLGTTGLSAAIINPQDNKFIGQGTSLNPQTTCGADVISRITYAFQGDEELERLRTLALEGISNLIKESTDSEIRSKIYAMVISGNTTMAHLLAGVSPFSLAQAPYRPVFNSSLDFSDFAADFGLPKEAKIFVAPSISAYIGGDITSGLLAVDMIERPGPILFIDIGTNGELVLVNKDKTLLGASCAVGPALEGMNITHGQRAMDGAIDSFCFGPGDWEPTFTVIGNKAPTGMCGSAIIEICSVLVDEGFIDKNGLLIVPENSRFKIPENVKMQIQKEHRFYLTEEIFFEQKDIRQVQLAKSAVATGVEMLLVKSNLEVSDLAEIIIAGSFGYHLNAKDLQTLTLLPKEFKGPINFVGNSSLAGAAKALLTIDGLDELNKFKDIVHTVELGHDETFQDRFMKHLRFN